MTTNPDDPSTFQTPAACENNNLDSTRRKATASAARVDRTTKGQKRVPSNQIEKNTSNREKTKSNTTPTRAATPRTRCARLTLSKHKNASNIATRHQASRRSE